MGEPRADARRHRGSRPLLVAGLACGAVVALLGAAGVPAASTLGVLAAGVLGLTGGVMVLRFALRGHRHGFRLTLGAGAVVWGVGQLLLGLDVVLGGALYPAPGDVVSALAAPLAVIGVARVPRRSRESLAGLRLACEAMISGSIAAAAVWRLGFGSVLDPGTLGGAAAVAIIVAQLSVVALFLIAAVREDDPGLTLTAAGITVYVVADLLTQYVVLEPGATWPWPGPSLACVGWPLVALGLLRIRARPARLPARDLPAAEQRRTLVTAVLNLGLLSALLLTVARDPYLDTVSVVLPGVCACALAVREIVLSRQQAELLGRLGELAYRDALTGLANRRALVERLRAHDRWQAACLLTLDLDNFKDVNGLLGHAAGDELLTRVGDKITEACGPHAEPFRLGGDEFALLCEGDLATAELLAQGLAAAVGSAARAVPGVGQVDLSASIGVARLPTDRRRRDPLRVLAESATALQAAKAAGRRRCVVYEGDVAAGAERRRLLESRLREALATGSLRVHGQPVVRLADGRVAGVEMLARWTDPVLGVVRPDEFVALAEATSLIVPLGDAVLDMALRAAVRHGLAARDVTVAVNVSPVQLRSPGFADGVLDKLVTHGIAASRLVLEVTESSFVDVGDLALPQIERLTDAGVVMAVDDFGAGAASLGYLRRMPVRVLKLDRSLVATMLTDTRSAAIVRSMARLGAETGVDVVAEGIEDAETARACREAGVSYGQGWLFARDVPMDTLEATLTGLGAPVLPGAGRRERRRPVMDASPSTA